MDIRQAKKVAYRRAYRILQSTMAAGWHPNELGDYSYSIFDTKRIMDAMDDIINYLWIRSSGNIEAKEISDRKRRP